MGSEQTTAAGGNDAGSVYNSWNEFIRPRTPEFACSFYRTFFAAAPHLRVMFPADMTGQQMKFEALMDTIIRREREEGSAEEDVRRLARSHSAFGVTMGQYLMFGKILIITLREMMGERWSDEHAAAWNAFFRRIYAVILDELSARDHLDYSAFHRKTGT